MCAGGQHGGKSFDNDVKESRLLFQVEINI
jgi:hypothetical protein